MKKKGVISKIGLLTVSDTKCYLAAEHRPTGAAALHRPGSRRKEKGMDGRGEFSIGKGLAPSSLWA